MDGGPSWGWRQGWAELLGAGGSWACKESGTLSSVPVTGNTWTVAQVWFCSLTSCLSFLTPGHTASGPLGRHRHQAELCVLIYLINWSPQSSLNGILSHQPNLWKSETPEPRVQGEGGAAVLKGCSWPKHPLDGHVAQSPALPVYSMLHRAV